jgi:hypothetical protein
MEGMFKANGGCGYVKKPDFLMKTGPHEEVFDPKVKLPVKKTLKVSAFILGLLTVFSFLESFREVPPIIYIYSFCLCFNQGYSSLVFQ